MSELIYASFPDEAHAHRAVGALMDHGVAADEVSLVVNHEERPTAADASDADPAERPITTTTAADAAVGAITGTGIGVGVGSLAALVTLFVPGVGLITGAGALATAIGAAVAASAAGGVIGGVVRYLKDLGVPGETAERYGEAVGRGAALAALHVPAGNLDRAEATALLTKYGATSIDAYPDLR